MKYLVIILVLFPMLFSCSGAKKQEGYSDNKCFNLCKANQICTMDEKDKRFHCLDQLPGPDPSATPGPDPSLPICSPPCTGNTSCQIDALTHKSTCVSPK
jgi:hypothetical protein